MITQSHFASIALREEVTQWDDLLLLFFIVVSLYLHFFCTLLYRFG